MLILYLWQDEVRLRLFLDSIGFSDLSAKKIKKWMPEDRRQFEIIQERYFSEYLINTHSSLTQSFLSKCFLMNFIVT